MLLDEQGHCKLSNFYVTKDLTGCAGGKTSSFLCDDVSYIAPEMLPDPRSYSIEVDWWSLGVLLFELTEHSLPYPQADQAELFHAIGHGLQAAPTHASPAVSTLLAGLLECDPVRRLGLKGVQAHALFSRADFWSAAAARTLPAPLVPASGPLEEAVNYPTIPFVKPGDEEPDSQEPFKSFDFAAKAFHV